MMMVQPQTTQLLLHGVIEARILEADLSVTTDGQLQPSKKVRIVYALLCCT
jgi:phospholipase D1/2